MNQQQTTSKLTFKGRLDLTFSFPPSNVNQKYQAHPHYGKLFCRTLQFDLGQKAQRPPLREIFDDFCCLFVFLVLCGVNTLGID